MEMKRCMDGRTPALLALTATLLLSATATAPATAQPTERFDMRVREHFFAGFGGDADALRRGMAIVEETLAQEPNHPQALVWQASGWNFQSGEAYQRGDPATGMTLFLKSYSQFDRAVSLAPDDPGVLIPRATTYGNAARYVTDAPTRAVLLAIAADDFARVLELQRPYLAQLSTHARGELFGGLSDALWQLDRRDEARPYLQRMVSELPGSPYAIMAGRRLDAPESADRLTCLGCHQD